MNSSDGRKYKSRKQQPCDACRRRKTCCVRESGFTDCQLCRSRSKECRFESIPKVRPGRVPKNRHTPDTTTISNDKPQPVQGKLGQTVSTRKSSTWRMQHVGLSSDQDPFVFQHCSFDDLGYFRRPDWVCLRVRKGGSIPMLFTVVPDKDVDSKPLYYPSSPFANLGASHERTILQSFFGIIHAAYPLLDPARFASEHVDNKLLRAAMFALAIPLCQEARDNSLSGYHTFILQALPIETRYPRLETVEAALLFFQRHTILNTPTTTPGEWSDVGSMVGMAQELGLNIDPTPWNISTTDRNRRIRIWWGVYIQERWSAFALGRSPNLNDEYCTTPMITLENFPQEGYQGKFMPQTSARIFVAIATLTTILSDIISRFYTIKAISRLQALSAEHIYNLVAQFDERLSIFRTQHLEPLYTVDTFLDSTGMLPVSGSTVFLAFNTLEVILCRAVLRNVNREDPGYQAFRWRAREILENVVMLVEKLQVNRLRAFWWSPMSRINFAVAGSFMYSNLLNSVDDDEVEYWTNEVDHYRQLLEMHSVLFDTTKLAAARMTLLASANEGYDESRDDLAIWDAESCLRIVQ